MRFVHCQKDQQTFLGFIQNEQVYAVNDWLKSNYKDLVDFLENGTAAELAKLQDPLPFTTTKGMPLSSVQLLSPIDRRRQEILCVGVNYAAHAVETGRVLTTEAARQNPPVFFSKRAAYLLGDQAYLTPRFDLDSHLDYEAELAVIIGKEAKDVSTETALDYVFGYSVFNDFSSRQLQRRHQQWLKGKSLDGYSAMGPWIVTKDAFDITKPHQVTCKVNGEIRQNASTDEMITKVPEIIATLSAGMTLYPGDIIATGTPAGVALGMEKPAWLKTGDKVECEISDIGSLTITIGSHTVNAKGENK
ncbi:fumarylacetoacetate hydrolase family protein [Enterococcus asini]|uniref:fumarylacetoacetate hydrolase family protein n=1 Tax=Enterococcus asini TaxID=57732 RepID=UPI002892256B|nr:fumarylacetoacetate hydrolase family protein [Enterococcus asini]MDT2756277.1 fumarylacetoacetate hydrolase family protein [Enterococcus asini]